MIPHHQCLTCLIYSKAPKQMRAQEGPRGRCHSRSPLRRRSRSRLRSPIRSSRYSRSPVYRREERHHHGRSSDYGRGRAVDSDSRDRDFERESSRSSRRRDSRDYVRFCDDDEEFNGADNSPSRRSWCVNGGEAPCVKPSGEGRSTSQLCSFLDGQLLYL